MAESPPEGVRLGDPSEDDEVGRVKADRLRAHLIAEHNFTADYFDEDYAIGGPIRDLSTLRWLHAPWVKTREYPKGCDRDV